MTAPDASDGVRTTEYGIPIRNVWHMLLYAWGHVGETKRWRGEVESSPSLEGLLALILAKLMEQRLRIGLGREYVAVHRRLRGIRGRVDFNRSLREQTFDRGEAYCAFESFEVNAPRNQVIKSVLARLVRVGRFGPDRVAAKQLRHRLRRLVRDLDTIDTIAVDLTVIRRVQLGRNGGDYRLMLSICEYLIQSVMPTEAAGRHASTNTNRDELTLFKVFEHFVAAFYKHHLVGWRVASQSEMTWPVDSSVPRLPTMKPDLVIRHPVTSHLTVIDTKFTAGSLNKGLGGKETYASSHLYQLYAYLRTQEARSEEHLTATGLLLYPGIDQQLSDRFVMQGHEVGIETVDMAGEWMEIERRLLEIVGHSETGGARWPSTSAIGNGLSSRTSW